MGRHTRDERVSWATNGARQQRDGGSQRDRLPPRHAHIVSPASRRSGSRCPGASALAARWRIAPIVVGLTLVAFGTSAPELVINLAAALRGRPTIALGNILGSNIFNIAAILGILAVFRPLPITRSTTWAEIPTAILAAVVMTAVASDVVTRSEGILLLGLFALFMAYIAVIVQRGSDSSTLPVAGENEQESLLVRRPMFAGGVVVGGLFLLMLGGEGVVRGAVGTAQLLLIPEYIIAATIVAIGTSLPELATGIVAVGRGEIDLAVGNAVGSNIFNVFLVIGLTAVVSPINTIPRPVDHGIHILVTLMLFLFVFSGPGRRIQRWEGILLLLVYGGYTAFLIGG